MTGFFIKTVVRGLLILLIAPLVLLLISAALLSSDNVNRWLLDKVTAFEPRLTLDVTDGQFWTGWELARIGWADEGLDLTLENVRFAWSPGCLWGRRLCIDQLTVDRITVLTSTDDKPATPRETIHLPAITLPLGIHLQELSIGSLWLDEEQPLLQDISLQAQVSGNQLHITYFKGQGPELDWELEGDVRLIDGWPVRLSADLNLPPIDNRPWQLYARASGSVADFKLEARSSGYLPGILTASAQPLQAQLPLAARWQGQPFLALQTLPQSLTLNDLMMDLQGSLEQGLNLKARSSMPGAGGEVNLSLTGKVMTSGVSDLILQLKVAEQPARQLSLNAEADWSGEISADTQLSMQDFPWQWLYPQDTGALTVPRLNLDAALRGEQFTADLRAQLSGLNEQTADLQLSLAGTAQEITLAPLTLSTPNGTLSGEAVVALLDGVAWNTKLLLKDLNPGMFVAELPGALSGPITSQGSLKNEQLQLAADWRVSGHLRQQPVQLHGAVTAAQDDWLVSDLLLSQGDNRITGAGRWGPAVSGHVDIALNRLQTLWPGLSGGLNGAIKVSGSNLAPAVAVNLQSKRLGFDELSLAQLSLDGQITLNDQLPGNLQFAVSQLRSGETRLGELELSLAGNKAAHNLALELQGGVVELSTKVSGKLDARRWSGLLSDASITSENMTWKLDAPAALNYQLASADLRLDAHCWSHMSSALCFTGEQQLMPSRKLDIRLTDFPMTSLQEWLPEDFTWDATLNAVAQFRQTAGAKPRGTVEISSRDGQITTSNLEGEVSFPYERLEFTTHLAPSQAKSVLSVISESLGDLNVQADIADPGGKQQLSGQFQLSNLQLSVLRPFLPQVNVLKGQLLGSGTLAGTLTEPDIQGKVRLSDGEISGPELPVSFEQLQLSVAIAGQQADIDGQWSSGKGQGRLQGIATWAPSLLVDIAITGKDLPVQVDPYAELLASPELHIGLSDNHLKLTGKIAVPEGNITVRELPETAVKVSADAIIVGATAPQDKPLPMEISADITLSIGDQLHFSGFGLSGRLRGQLEVKENMTATGDLNILDGRFRGYGQRLQLRRAQILFAGPISQPYLDIEAIRKVNDVVAGLRLTGPADAPISEVFSEPGMAQEQALAYLILGRPLGADSGDSNLLGQAALALGMAGSTPLAKNVAESLGIEDFQLDTEGSGLTTSVVATGYLTDKLSLRYGVGVFEQANQLALRYDLTKRLYLEAVGGLASSLDFFYRIDF